MSDLSGDAIVAASVRRGELLRHDYFTHRTTLALVSPAAQ